MDISELLQIFSNTNKKNEEEKIDIPKEIADQYPYGQFPIRYTKLGQEEIRKQSENRFSYTEDKKEEKNEDKGNNFDIKNILPIIQLMSSGKKNSKDLMKIFTKLLFKDNPTYEKLFSSLTNFKSQEINTKDEFPDTNKVAINSLKRVN